MSKEQYLMMCEQTGEEIDWDKCPPEIEDFMNRKYLVGVFLPTIFPLVGASNNFIPNKSRSLLWIRTK